MRLGVARISVPVEVISDLLPFRDDDARRVKEPVVSGNVPGVVLLVAFYDAPRNLVWEGKAFPACSILVPKIG